MTESLNLRKTVRPAATILALFGLLPIAVRAQVPDTLVIPPDPVCLDCRPELSLRISLGPSEEHKDRLVFKKGKGDTLDRLREALRALRF